MQSLEQVFRGLPDGQMLVGFDALQNLRKPPTLIAQIVREPKDRLWSMYSYFSDGETWRHPMPGMEHEEVQEWYYETWGAGGPTMTFDHFVRSLPSVIDNHHFRPQWSEHADLAQVRGRLDNVQPFWYAVRTHAPGLPIKFPHANRSRARHAGDLEAAWDTLSPEALTVYEENYGPDELFYNQTAMFQK